MNYYYYYCQRPHQGLRYDEFETPAVEVDRLLPSADDAESLVVADEGEQETK